jgi:hypothetical protein
LACFLDPPQVDENRVAALEHFDVHETIVAESGPRIRGDLPGAPEHATLPRRERVGLPQPRYDTGVSDTDPHGVQVVRRAGNEHNARHELCAESAEVGSLRIFLTKLHAKRVRVPPRLLEDSDRVLDELFDVRLRDAGLEAGDVYFLSVA